MKNSAQWTFIKSRFGVVTVIVFGIWIARIVLCVLHINIFSQFKNRPQDVLWKKRYQFFQNNFITNDKNKQFSRKCKAYRFLIVM